MDPLDNGKNAPELLFPDVYPLGGFPAIAKETYSRLEQALDEDMDCGVCGGDIAACGGHPFDPRYPDAPHLQPCFCGAEPCLKATN